jgi:hypothetical protein
MTTDAGLDTRLFVATDPKIIGAKRLAVPEAGVQIQHRRGLGAKARSARENPVTIPPRLDGVALQRTPDGRSAHRARPDIVDPTGDISRGLPTQRLVRL